MSISKYSLLAFYLAVCFAVSYFGAQFSPGEWYEQLNRAPWSPPNLAFPIVWTILYALIAFVGFRLHAGVSGATRLSTWLWWGQLALNAVWSWLFFGQHWVGSALIDILLLALVISVLIHTLNKSGDKLSARLLAPYLAWIILACSLNTYIFIAN